MVDATALVLDCLLATDDTDSLWDSVVSMGCTAICGVSAVVGAV